MTRRLDLPAGHRSPFEPEGHGLDPAADVEDVEHLAPDVEHRGDVLIDERLRQRDPRVHHPQHAIGADEPDWLDPPAPPPTGRELVRRLEQPSSQVIFVLSSPLHHCSG